MNIDDVRGEVLEGTDIQDNYEYMRTTYTYPSIHTNVDEQIQRSMDMHTNIYKSTNIQISQCIYTR